MTGKRERVSKTVRRMSTRSDTMEEGSRSSIRTDNLAMHLPSSEFRRGVGGGVVLHGGRGGCDNREAGAGAKRPSKR